jgi:hypothetical protein
MTTRWILTICTLALAGGLGGCGTASQPPAAVASPVPAGMARFYVLREPTIYDSPTWTAVSLNGEVAGSSAPGTVFYRDVAPGTYRVEARSDKLYPDQVKTVVVRPGSATFVRVDNLPNWGQSPRQWSGTTFTVEIIDPAIGRVEIGKLQLTPG